ncbi:DUF3043 domain-containing protein [Planomonospora parontospora]|uniref:DUF3043 domain-containing protein n=1 Tax=Planomonospora parontospora TaxID=58119 RepID=UPI00167010AD|nr:DUF3043 domain-containing protein [Planomonospora parontospora]GGL04203.1 hypothetical protein GCM10014719_02920 [Planomonospora parontospora subsp. antibiotica]GII13451.1 hypothetical protein Ppa05_01770 [Planomonospora parontospora subsp. antibiotica]
MFRRTQTTADDSPVSATDPKPAGKGRPTPKRRDAEGRRRQPVTAPKNRKEAYKNLRERQAADRAKAREGMMRGDERYFPARDRGPVRKFARDWVDSRRLVSQYFLPFSLAILLLTWIPFPVVVRGQVTAAVIGIGWPIMMLGVLFTSIWVSWKVKKLAAEKFPGESLRGVGFYAAMRALQIRKLRFPPPQFLPGGKPVPPKK